MLYFLINNKPILIRSMLAAGIVQDKVVGEAILKRRLLEATSTATCTGTLTAQAKKKNSVS